MSGRRAGDTVVAVCDELERVYEDGSYPLLEVTRPWSTYNPVIDGELARPCGTAATTSSASSATCSPRVRTFSVRPSRPRLALNDPALLRGADESSRNLKQKKLFLFSAERMELSFERLAHYTGTDPALFQRHVLLTNYGMHMEAFLERFPDAVVAPSGRRRCPPTTGWARRARACRWSTSGSARRTRRPSPTTSRCSVPTCS